jgi:hypothetical protein
MLHRALKTAGRMGRHPLPGTFFFFLLRAQRAEGRERVQEHCDRHPACQPRLLQPLGRSDGPGPKATQARTQKQARRRACNRSAAAIYKRHTRDNWSRSSGQVHPYRTRPTALSRPGRLRAAFSRIQPPQIQSCVPRVQTGCCCRGRTPGCGGEQQDRGRSERPVAGLRQEAFSLHAGYLPHGRDDGTARAVY